MDSDRRLGQELEARTWAARVLIRHDIHAPSTPPTRECRRIESSQTETQTRRCIPSAEGFPTAERRLSPFVQGRFLSPRKARFGCPVPYSRGRCFHAAEVAAGGPHTGPRNCCRGWADRRNILNYSELV